MSKNAFPRTDVPLPHVLSPATFDQVMQAGFSQKAKASGTPCTVTRDQALIWVLFDTGITIAEARALRLADLDLQKGLLRVRGKGGKERLMPLESTCMSHLRSHLRQMTPTTKRGLVSRQAGGDPLFGSQDKQPLTKNGATMVFARFRKRAAVREIRITPQILRHSFALRYLQAGGSPDVLQELLGYERTAPVRQYLRWSYRRLHEPPLEETEGI